MIERVAVPFAQKIAAFKSYSPTPVTWIKILTLERKLPDSSISIVWRENKEPNVDGLRECSLTVNSPGRHSFVMSPLLDGENNLVGLKDNKFDAFLYGSYCYGDDICHLTYKIDPKNPMVANLDIAKSLGEKVGMEIVNKPTLLEKLSNGGHLWPAQAKWIETLMMYLTGNNYVDGQEISTNQIGANGVNYAPLIFHHEEVEG